MLHAHTSTLPSSMSRGHSLTDFLDFHFYEHNSRARNRRKSDTMLVRFELALSDVEVYIYALILDDSHCIYDA